MKDNGQRALIIGILFMLAAIGAFMLRQPPEKKKTDFSQATAATETTETTSGTAAALSMGTTSVSVTTTVTTTVTRVSTTKATVTTTAVVTETETETVSEFLRLDLNKATAAELALLNGIGDTKAAAIIAYREEHGVFRSIEERMQVGGIGQETFEAIKEHIYVEVTEVTEPETAASAVIVTTAVPEITVLAQTTAAEPETEHVLTLEEAAPININTAGAEELMLLPHVDREIAEHIIRLRGELNGFGNTYELLLIDELTQKQVAEILEFVTIGQ